MTAILMDGKSIAVDVRSRIAKDVARMKQHGVEPYLATILVGDNPASRTYLKMKHKACEEVGIKSENYEIPEQSSEKELMRLVKMLATDKSVHGILVQLPLPAGLSEYHIIENIPPEKDVDGLHPVNSGRIALKKGNLIPCTPKGVMMILKHYNISTTSKHVLIINRTNLVGRPLAMLMLNADATVTVAHSKTKDLLRHMKNADIVITAVGRRPDFIVTGEMIKPGATVVDIGTSKVDGKIIGDVDFESVNEKAAFLTPVPGGVGPMTVAMLLHNTFIAAANQTNFKLSYGKDGI